MSSIFESALGRYQGRIKPTGWTPEQGEYVWCLGYDLPGHTARVDFGNDDDAIEQSADVSSSKLVRLVIHERAPASIPVSQEWVLETLLDGSVVISAPLAARRERTRRDLALDVSALAGAHTIKVMLRAAGSTIADAELPGVYIDAWRLTASEPARPTVFNRDPEPGDVEVPLDGVINFDLADLDGVGLASTFDVTVDGVPAITGGFLQPPWDTSGSLITALTNGVRVGLVPATPWVSLSEHTVRVIAATTDGAQIDLSWTWTAKDATPPRILSAFSPARDQVRVTFDEALDAATATTASNYTVALVSGAPAVTPVVTAASAEAPGVVLLSLDRWQTPRAVYAVTVAAVKDVHGNVIAAPYNVAQWIGYELPQAPGRRFDLFEMWAGTGHYADPTGDLRKWMAVWQEVVDHWLFELDDYTARVLDPDTADEAHVDQMLRDLGNPFSIELSLTDKRRLLRVLLPLLRQRGTEEGIENAIRTLLGLEVTVVPVIGGGLGLGAAAASVSFYLSSGDLAKKLSYDIESPVVLTDAQRAAIRRIARIMQRGVCHLRRFVEPVPPTPPAVPPALSKGARLSVSWYLTGP